MQQNGKNDFINEMKAVGALNGINYNLLSGYELKDKFPYFGFPNTAVGLYEVTNSGWINPRIYLAAVKDILARKYAKMHVSEVVRIEYKPTSCLVTCRSGKKFQSRKIIAACGSYSKNNSLLTRKVDLQIFGRTIALFEIDEKELCKFKDMPSVVYKLTPNSPFFYVLPPIKYPDGKYYIKAGGESQNKDLSTNTKLQNWFKGCGDPVVGEILRDQVLATMPNLKFNSLHYESCVVTATKTRLPIIDHVNDRTILLTGGNGAAAKCADELGRIAVELSIHGSIETGKYATTFKI